MTSIRVAKCMVLALLVASLISSCKGKGKVGNHPEAGLPANNLRLLTGRAALIFKGVVSGLEYETDAKTGLPFTFVTFRQIEPLKDLGGQFTSGKRERLRVRLFGGVKEDGTMTLMSHIPRFKLGAVYLVFYTGGKWDVSPIVGGDRGVFQVVKSRTLGYEMLLDHAGAVVVGASGDTLKTLPLMTEGSHVMREIRHKDEAVVKQTDQVKVARQTIYTEEGVERMMASKGAEIEFEKEEAATARQETPKSLTLKTLPTPPMPFKQFSKRIMEVDKKYASEFHKYYSEIHLEGESVERERRPFEFNEK